MSQSGPAHPSFLPSFLTCRGKKGGWKVQCWSKHQHTQNREAPQSTKREEKQTPLPYPISTDPPPPPPPQNNAPREVPPHNAQVFEEEVAPGPAAVAEEAALEDGPAGVQPVQDGICVALAGWGVVGVVGGGWSSEWGGVCNNNTSPLLVIIISAFTSVAAVKAYVSNSSERRSRNSSTRGRRLTRTRSPSSSSSLPGLCVYVCCVGEGEWGCDRFVCLCVVLVGEMEARSVCVLRIRSTAPGG